MQQRLDQQYSAEARILVRNLLVHALRAGESEHRIRLSEYLLFDEPGKYLIRAGLVLNPEAPPDQVEIVWSEPCLLDFDEKRLDKQREFEERQRHLGIPVISDFIKEEVRKRELMKEVGESEPKS